VKCNHDTLEKKTCNILNEIVVDYTRFRLEKDESLDDKQMLTTFHSAGKMFGN